MTRFIPFDTAEEMDAFLEDQRCVAAQSYERTLEEQRELKPGDRYVRLTQEGFAIFGEILDPAATGDAIEEPWLRLCRSFSIACPCGKIGTEFVQVMVPLSRELFEQASDHAWQITVAIDAEIRLFFEKFEATFNKEVS